MGNNDYTDKISVEQVSDSIECVRCRRLLKLYVTSCILLLFLLAALLCIINTGGYDKHRVLVTSSIICAMYAVIYSLLIWQIISSANRTKAIKKGVGKLPVYKVVFDRIRKSVWTGSRFVLEIPDGSGNTVETLPIFSAVETKKSSGGTYTPVQSLHVDNFIGKKVFIMYDPDKNKVYVLGLADYFALPTDTL
ncbi:MAG: hypothetical protein K2M36_00255 [Clostridia bacterium]|nr:hypothetical protein [Clostridia bacterium]